MADASIAADAPAADARLIHTPDEQPSGAVSVA
jgi:hypothetical protein